MENALTSLGYGFSVALDPHNLIWAFFGVLVGNLIGVLPGLGPLSAIALLLPLTFPLNAIPAIMMLAGIFYGSQYGGAIGAILLNLPVHPPHAVTCVDGYPMTKRGRGGAALGIAMLSSFFAASFGIVVMIFASPLLVAAAANFGAAEMFAIMLIGLLAGGMIGSRSPLKGAAMVVLGLFLGTVGTDVSSGTLRFTLGLPGLWDKVDLVALALGMFGVAEFLLTVNRFEARPDAANLRLRDLRPSLAELKEAIAPMLRGTFVGTLFGAMPGTGSTITAFIAYAFERKISRRPERFGTGAIEGVAAPEAANHSKTQVDFIPTMTLGIPGDSVMALILGALIIHGIEPGPLLMQQHRDLFWGLVASFWIGNVLLLILNVPLLGIWLRLLRIPFRYLFPAALFFIAVGVYSTNNSLFDVGELLVFGLAGAGLIALRFPAPPLLLGFILSPMLEENFRRALMLSRGDLGVFVSRPLSAALLCVSAALIASQVGLWVVRASRGSRGLPQASPPRSQSLG